MTWCILVNGRPNREGIISATRHGGKILRDGGTAVDAVESTIKMLEDNPSFDAGTGCEINVFGDILMDASIMDGKELKCGAVGAVSNIKNPISIARKVMDLTSNVLLVGKYAERFASYVAENDTSIVLGYDPTIPKTRSAFRDIKNMIMEEIDHKVDEKGDIYETRYGVERIPDLMLLKEMQAYHPGLNVDRLVAFCALVAFAKVQQSNRGYHKRLEQQNSNLEKSEKSYKLKLNPFRHIGTPSSKGSGMSKPRSAFKNLR